MVPPGQRLALLTLSSGVTLLALSGCLGPVMVRRTQARYNEAVHTAGNEELLLNLVRLRYGEGVKFLPITSITDQFEIDTGSYLGRIS